MRAFRTLTPLFVLALGTTLGAQAPQRADSAARDSVPTMRRRAQLEPVIVTGSLGSSQSVGVAHSVVDQAQLVAEPERQAVDALRHVTGVHIDEANGPLGPTIIRLRGGEETFTRVLMDGVELNENGGFFDAQGISLLNVDRIEVARGPQSAVYGSSAMSGVVQLFTRSGEPGPTQVEAGIELGRNMWYGRNLRGNVSAQGGSDALRYAFGLGSSYDRGIYRVPNDLRSKDASMRVDLEPASSLVITGVARFMGVDGKLPVRDPGLVAPLDSNQRQGRDRYVATIQSALAAGEHWTHRLQVSDYRRDFTYDDGFDNLDQSQFTSYVFDANFHYKSIVRRVNARYVGTAVVHPKRADLSLSYGAEYERESLSDNQSGDFGPASQTVMRPSTSVFAEAQASIAGRASVLLGSRVEKFRGLEAANVPRAALVLQVLPRVLAVRGTVAKAYKAPNIQEQFPSQPSFVANPDLKPETSDSWEVGTDITPWGSLVTTSLTYFYQNFQNLIRTVNYDATHQISRNIGRSRAAGLEAEVAVRPAPRWTVGSEASWIATRIVDNGGLSGTDFPSGATLPFRPTYTASAYVDAPITRAVSLVTRVTAVGPQTVLAYRFSGPRVGIPGYNVLDATGTWQITKRTSTYVAVSNILNTYYKVDYRRPGFERELVVGARTGIIP